MMPKDQGESIPSFEADPWDARLFFHKESIPAHLLKQIKDEIDG